MRSFLKLAGKDAVGGRILARWDNLRRRVAGEPPPDRVHLQDEVMPGCREGLAILDRGADLAQTQRLELRVLDRDGVAVALPADALTIDGAP